MGMNMPKKDELIRLGSVACGCGYSIKLDVGEDIAAYMWKKSGDVFIARDEFTDDCDFMPVKVLLSGLKLEDVLGDLALTEIGCT